MKVKNLDIICYMMTSLAYFQQWNVKNPKNQWTYFILKEKIFISSEWLDEFQRHCQVRHGLDYKEHLRCAVLFRTLCNSGIFRTTIFHKWSMIILYNIWYNTIYVIYIYIYIYIALLYCIQHFKNLWTNNLVYIYIYIAIIMYYLCIYLYKLVIRDPWLYIIV